MTLSRPGKVRLAAGLVSLALLALLARPGLAHTDLVAAGPAPGQTLAQPPDEIRLTFNEPLGPGSTFLVLTETFAEISLPAPEVDPTDPTRLVTAVPEGALAPGMYTVQWFVASADGHPATGSYTFAIAEDEAGLADRGLLVAFILVVSFAGLAWLAGRARSIA